MANILRNVDQIFKSDGSEFTSGGGSTDTNLGIDVVQESGDINYDFNSLTPTAMPTIDTSALTVGSTVSWNGSTWASTGLIIEEI